MSFCGGSIRQGAVKFVEEILSVVKPAAISSQEGFAQQTGGEAGFSGAWISDKDNVLGLSDEIELSEVHNLGFIDAGLLFKREALQGPIPGQFCLADTIKQALLLLVGVFLR